MQPKYKIEDHNDYFTVHTTFRIEEYVHRTPIEAIEGVNSTSQVGEYELVVYPAKLFDAAHIRKKIENFLDKEDERIS